MNRPNAGLCSLFLVLAAAPGLRAADAPARPAAPGQARALVRLLASEDFAVREDATRRLADLGKGAEAALKEGADDDDPEVRRRCSELLALANRSDLEVALSRFLATHDEQALEKLPAYPRFVKAAGDTPQARGLFVEMCLADAALMVDAEKDPAAAAAAVTERCRQHQQQLRFGVRPVPLGQVAALLYVAT